MWFKDAHDGNEGHNNMQQKLAETQISSAKPLQTKLTPCWTLMLSVALTVHWHATNPQQVV